jgi:predicted Fe-Mo cluster-binding NifX family protein
MFGVDQVDELPAARTLGGEAERARRGPDRTLYSEIDYTGEMGATRIAIGTADGVSVCGHLARSASFLVFDIEGGEVKDRHERQRATDQCGNHRTFTEMLEGCSAVLCGGIGQGAYDSLVGAGIRPLILKQECTVEQALAGYFAGTLALTDDRVCLCSH